MYEQNIEQIINILKKELEPVQEKINKQYTYPKSSVILIIGSPRSGTTLLLQYLSASGIFTYPTNLLTRFAYAPYLGSHIQQLLFNNKIGMDSQHVEFFNSDLGKSEGLVGVNEFFHFWRRFIPAFFPKYIEKSNFQKIKFKQIFQELASIENVFNKPFACKGMMLQYNLADLGQNAKHFLFLRVKRDPMFVMQSIFLARKKYNGNTKTWWSVKPKEYEFLKKMDVYHQIAGQVFYSEKAISQGLTEINKKQQLTISYENFCNNPIDVTNKLANILSIDSSLKNMNIPQKFEVSKKVKIKDTDFTSLKKAYFNFKNKEIEI